MLRSLSWLFLISTVLFLSLLPARASELTRDLSVTSGQKVEVHNRSGRITIRALKAGDDPVAAKVTASSTGEVGESEVKVSSSGRTVITVNSKDISKRIDLVIDLPERTELILETGEGAIDINGNFKTVSATTGTGTIAVDVPDDDVKYTLLWTESHPRYVADFDLKEIKEKSGGRFEIRGHYGETTSKKKEKKKIEDSEADVPTVTPTGISLDLITARGIILINVPPNEVMSDLRERPLTNAAKAIVRSGDTLLMESIRRAAPKYYGDYARSLPPIERPPQLSKIATPAGSGSSELKSAVVRITDLKNRAIPNLRANDFEVIEAGVPREVVSVERSTAPFDLVLLLDVSGSVENYVNFIRKAARSFVETVDKRDRVSIVIFNEDVRVLAKFTSDKGQLSESLDTFDAGGGTAYYDALAYTVADTLRPLKGGRTAIVILTDGDDNRSFLAFDSLVGPIEESGALVYPLYVPSALIAAAASGTDIDPLRKRYMSLSAKSEGEGERLAQISGGVYYPISEVGQIQKAYSDIVGQLRSAYTVTFRSDPSIPADDTRRLRIRSKGENTFATISSVRPADR